MDLSVPYSDSRAWRRGLSTEHALHDRLAVSLLCLGAVSLGSHWKHQDLSSPFWRLYLDKREGARIRTGEGWLPLEAGRMYLIPAWIAYATAAPEGVEHIYVHFDLRGPPAPVLRELFPRPLRLADRPERAERLAALGDRLAQGATPDPAMLLAARALVDDCLAEAVTGLPPGARDQLTAHALYAGPLGRVLAHIDLDPAADCSAALLARLAGCSPDHLARLFRRHLGQSPGRYVAERRIAAAARALAFGADSIEAVAQAHGFANRYSFTRAFSRQLGASPARWRRTRA